MSQRIAFVASPTEEAQAARSALAARYGDVPIDAADVIVALGGDGFMLRTLHRHMARGLPVYGMKLGTVGFLMNQHHARRPAATPRARAVDACCARWSWTSSPKRAARSRRSRSMKSRCCARPNRPRTCASRSNGVGQDRRTDVRRRPRRDAGGIDRLQPVGARPDPAARLAAARDDADQPVPSAALARRDPVGRSPK